MRVEIRNCNNIDSGTVELVENKLNIKYAINGTGKSTISKAICSSIEDSENGTKTLEELTPFKALEDDQCSPSISGIESISSFKVFDEGYINDFIFQPDELLRGSFEVFIRGDQYDAGIQGIESLVGEIKTLLSEDQEVQSLINDFNELSASFGRPTKSGIHGSSAMAKALKKGNKVQNVPQELEVYTPFIQGENNIEWIGWQIKGSKFSEASDQCPYCVGGITEKKETIAKVGEVYEPKAVDNLNKVISVFRRLDKYFSEDTRRTISEFVQNIDGYSDDQVAYLNEVREQIDRLNNKFRQVQSLGFLSLKDVDQVIEQLKGYRIDMKLFNHLRSSSTEEKASKVNESLDKLLEKASELQGKIRHQKRIIERLVQENKASINEFLKNAGYKYSVDLIEDKAGQHKLKLLHVDAPSEIGNVKTHLSYGERNAFALVLFMFDALKSQPDLIVLDDPISSFDKNKKYAIIEMLFKDGQSFRGKTVLFLTHDFEPVVDMGRHHPDRFDPPSMYFLENNHGVLTEKVITKGDIKTFIQINEANIRNGENLICQLVYLRRIYEVTNSKGLGYELVSNVFHKRPTPITFDEDRTEIPMAEEDIQKATEEIRQRIDSFDYGDAISMVTDETTMRELYSNAQNNYEKLHFYRILFDDADTQHPDVINKFINQAFHIENDYIYQLDPTQYQTVPQYVIDECDRVLFSEPTA